MTSPLPNDSDRPPPRVWSRRKFLTTGGSGLVVTCGGLLGAVVETVFADPAAAADAPDITVRLVRPADQLDAVLELFDVRLDSGTGLIESDGADPRMRVVLAAQHTAEDAVVDPIANPPTGAAFGARAAGPSWLVTSLATPVPFTVDDLLDTRSWTLRTSSAAGTPGHDTSAIELPAGLAIAPGVVPDVDSTGAPRTVDSVTELWRVSLADPSGGPLDVVAVANVAPADDVVNAVPDTVQRDELVANTTAVAPATAERLILSGHGAFAQLDGTWDGQTVSRWRQSVITGRDIVAEVVQEGYLMPFGHRAKILEINSRRFVDDADGNPAAVLSYERFLAIDESEVVFDGPEGTDGDPGMEYRRQGGRGLPFSSVTIAPTEWIPIDTAPVSDAAGDIPGVVDLLPDGQSDVLPLVFDATDRAGNGGIGFTMPATFVDVASAHAPTAGGALDRLAAKLTDSSWIDRFTLPMAGRRVAFADELGEGTGATTFATNALQLGLSLATGGASDLQAAGRLGLFPVLDLATIVDDGIAAALGEAGVPIDVVPHPRWLQFGLGDDNFDLAFLDVLGEIEASLGLEGRSVVAVDLIGDLLNQTAGIGQELDLGDVWSAAQALGADSKLLGLVPLSSIIPDVDVADLLPGIDIPGLDVDVSADGIKTTFAFSPSIASVPLLGFYTESDDPKAVIENVTCVPFDGTPTNTLTMRLDDIRLELPPQVPLVILRFARIEVVESTVDGLSIDPELTEWTWGPFLNFLKPVTDLLDGLGAGLLNVSPRAIEINKDFSLPSVPLGVVSIRNATLTSNVELPFTGGDLPAVGLGLGSAAHPVEVSVLSFEAGFYLEVDVSPGSDGGLRRLAAGVELTAQLFGIDIVVAEANVSLRLGAHFTLKSESGITFTGSIALEGNIEVLGLVSVSAALVATLKYREAKQDLKVSGHIEWAVETFLGGPSGQIPLGEMRYDLGDDLPAGGALAASTAAAPAAASSMATTSPTPAAATRPSPSFGHRFSESEWRDLYVTAFA